MSDIQPRVAGSSQEIYNYPENTHVAHLGIGGGDVYAVGPITSKQLKVVFTTTQMGTGYWPMSLSSSNIESTKIADLYDGDNIVDIPSQFWKENPITIDIEYSVEVENQIQVSSTIQISCSTPDSQIYYTLDNSTPDSSKSLYSNQFEVESGTTIKAIAIKSGYIDSDIAEYVVN